MGGMLLWEWQRKTVIVSAVVLIPIRTVVIDMVRLHASVVMLVGNFGMHVLFKNYVNVAANLNAMAISILDGLFFQFGNQVKRTKIEYVVR